MEETKDFTILSFKTTRKTKLMIESFVRNNYDKFRNKSDFLREAVEEKLNNEQTIQTV